ncbi:MAG TPA: hypothetical protein VHQ93_17935 [Chitinophagaceae bacterium]|jgi:hypothetical protein|nr:hypothetical protein [Chitinophagaceae bacterium]
MKTIATILIFILSIVSCGTSKIVCNENLNDQGALLISMQSYKVQGKPYHELTAKLTDSAGNITVYWITSTCNCIRKEKKVKSHPKQYKLVADSNYELEVNNDDKIVLQKFRSLPEIEMFCSTALLDSAKGFIQTNKKLKNPPK